MGKNCEKYSILKTKNGIIKRPIQRLYPLEIHQDNNSISDDNSAKDEIKRDESYDVIKSIFDNSNSENKVKVITTRSGRVSRKPERMGY